MEVLYELRRERERERALGAGAVVATVRFDQSLGKGHQLFQGAIEWLCFCGRDTLRLCGERDVVRWWLIGVKCVFSGGWRSRSMYV